MDGGVALLERSSLATPARGLPELYHAASSYYSMIARLALIENRIPFRSHPLDIHRRLEHQAPWYVRINPGMTVPSLRLAGRDLTDSRDILMLAFGRRIEAMDDPARRWVDELYAFPVDAFTFSWLMSWNPLARHVLPRKLAAIERSLCEHADSAPDLATAYRSRADVFATRCATLVPTGAGDRFRALKARATGMLDRLERELGRDAPAHAPDSYGPQDVLWTVFLARLQFCRLQREIDSRPLVRAYYRQLKARPSFVEADIWTRLRLRKLLDLIG
jgi:glutathione S-transferase